VDAEDCGASAGFAAGFSATASEKLTLRCERFDLTRGELAPPGEACGTWMGGTRATGAVFSGGIFSFPSMLATAAFFDLNRAVRLLPSGLQATLTREYLAKKSLSSIQYAPSFAGTWSRASCTRGFSSQSSLLVPQSPIQGSACGGSRTWIMFLPEWATLSTTVRIACAAPCAVAGVAGPPSSSWTLHTMRWPISWCVARPRSTSAAPLRLLPSEPSGHLP